MRAAGNRVNAAIRALLVAALLQEPRATTLLKVMGALVAEIAHTLVKTRQWGSDRVRALALFLGETALHGHKLLRDMCPRLFNCWVQTCVCAGQVDNAVKSVTWQACVRLLPQVPYRGA